MTAVGNPNGRNEGELRRLAESRVPESRVPESRVPESLPNASQMPSDECGRLAYELKVHQEERLVQNEELRRIRLELQKSREQYAELYDFAPVGYLTIDEQGVIVELNLTAATMLREGPSQLVGRQLGLYFEHGSQAELLDHIDRAFASRTEQSCELALIGNDAESLEIRLDSLKAVRPTSSGEQYRGELCRVIMTDIAQCKRAEKALAEKDKYLKLLADALPALVSYVDKGCRFAFCNAAHEIWFGKSPSVLEGQLLESIHDHDNYQLIAASLAEVFGGKRVQIEIPLEHSTLGRRHFHVILVPDVDMAGEVQGFHCLGIDATEQKILDQQIERRRAVLARLNTLSAPERALYDLLASGKSNQFIAATLDIGLRTAERRRQIVLNKLQVETLSQWLQQLADVDVPSIAPHATIA